MPKDSLIRLRGVNLTRSGRQLLKQINLDLELGKITTLIGPNGAGKTTLVRCILGLLKPDSGEVVRQHGLSIGYMPQKLHLDASLPLSVERFLKLAGGDTDSIAQALQRVGIARLCNSPMTGLSGGEVQRVLLARALLRRPQLLVLDEPVQGVDVMGQNALYKLINQLRDELGCAVLMVSHDLHLVMSTTDEVICLNQHICCHGHPDSVSADPAFIELFGEQDNAIALYTHHHDHSHTLHGEVKTCTHQHNSTQSPCNHG